MKASSKQRKTSTGTNTETEKNAKEGTNTGKLKQNKHMNTEERKTNIGTPEKKIL